MGEVKKKNYILYALVKKSEIPIQKGSLSELDDFTTYFESKEVLAKMYLRDLVSENEHYDFYIISSRGTRYRILYNEHRFIPTESKKIIIECLMNMIDSEELIKYIENNTKIFEYLESDRKDYIPLCILYNLAEKNDRKFLSLFKNMLENDYSFYRNIVLRYKDHIRIKYAKPLSKERKEEIKNESHEIYSSIWDIINSKIASDNESEILIDEKEEQILNIINSYDDSYEIIEQLELFMSDEYERNHYFNKYRSLIYRNEQ